MTSWNFPFTNSTPNPFLSITVHNSEVEMGFIGARDRGDQTQSFTNPIHWTPVQMLYTDGAPHR
jgi:hypothetical protein